MGLDDFRRRSKAVWEAMAAGWEKKRAYLGTVARPVGEWLITNLDVRPGQTILELACGPGDTGFAAAPLLGPTGRLILTDFASGMVEAARRRGAELGLTNVEYRVMDAERMDLPAGSVDGVLCRWGYMLMADPATAFKETRRVLRRGGRLCFAVFASPERNPWAAMPARVLVEGGHMAPPAPESPGILALGNPDRIKRLLADAGFGVPRIDEVPIVFRFESTEDYWSFLTDIAGALAAVITELPEERQRGVRRAIEDRLGAFRADGSYALPGVCLNVVTS
ncbi:MAG TPA: class I SAM-dependent methyltransferase [Methylomirabilota bacterium]|nr:class I SAM-dependent methyltransferase [Methylomirabilota bacterium]